MNPRARLAVGVTLRVLAYVGFLVVLGWLVIIGFVWVLTSGGNGLAELGEGPSQKSAHFTEDVVLSLDRPLVIREVTATVDPRGGELDGVSIQGGVSVIEGSRADAWVGVLDAENKAALDSPGLEGILRSSFPGDCQARACSRTYVLAACLLTTNADSRVAIHAAAHVTVTGPGNSKPPADVGVERLPLDLDPSWNDLLAAKTNGRCSRIP